MTIMVITDDRKPGLWRLHDGVTNEHFTSHEALMKFLVTGRQNLIRQALSLTKDGQYGRAAWCAQQAIEWGFLLIGLNDKEREQWEE